MFREWSVDLLRIIVLAIFVVAVTAISTDIYLTSAIVFPIVFALFVLEQKPGGIESLEVKVPEKAWVGETMLVECSFECPTPGTAINLELLLPEQFEIVDGTNVHIFYRGKKQGNFRFEMKVRTLRRGEYSINLLKYVAHSTGGGLRRTAGRITLNKNIEVVPRVQVMKKRNIKTFSKKFVPRQSTARIGPPSTEFDSIRNYVHGDPVKSINWKATARVAGGGGLLVNQYEKEGMSTTLIVLDRGGYMKKGTPDTNPFESGIRATLTISRLLLDRRINTGFWYGQKFRGRAGYVQPSSDLDNFQRIKKALLFGETAEAVKVPIDPGKLFYDHLMATGANVLLMTNVAEINSVSISNFVKGISRMASNIVVLDILPFGIISNYHGSGIVELYGDLILRKANAEIYKSLPSNARIFSWDPEIERMSGVLSSISSYLR